MKKACVILLFFCLLSNYKTKAQNQKVNNVAWIKGGSRDCFQLITSPNNQYFLSLNFLGAQLWSAESKSLIKLIPYNLGFGSYPFVFSLNGDKLYYADSSKIKCLNIEADSIEFIIPGHHKVIRSLCLSIDGYTLLSAADDSLAITWNLDGTPRPIRKYYFKKGIWKAFFTNNDKDIIALSRKDVTILEKESEKKYLG